MKVKKIEEVETTLNFKNHKEFWKFLKSYHSGKWKVELTMTLIPIENSNKKE